MKPHVRELINIAYMLLGIFSAALGLHGFLLSSGLIDGGVTGVSMLVSALMVRGFGLTFSPLPILILLINLPFIALGYRQIGRAFAIRSASAIGGLSIVLAVVHFPDVVHDDKLLTAVFGGFFLGAGIGLAIRGGAVLDGTEIAALLISKRNSMIHVGDVILALNIVIFLTAAFFLGVDKALYSILTYIAASKTLDFLLHGIEEYTAITVISEQHEAIRKAITGVLGRGVTIYKGRGGLTGVEQEILFCVVTRLEIGKVRRIIQDMDKSAFIIIYPLADVHGGVFKKSHVH